MKRQAQSRDIAAPCHAPSDELCRLARGAARWRRVHHVVTCSLYALLGLTVTAMMTEAALGVQASVFMSLIGISMVAVAAMAVLDDLLNSRLTVLTSRVLLDEPNCQCLLTLVDLVPLLSGSDLRRAIVKLGEAMAVPAAAEFYLSSAQLAGLLRVVQAGSSGIANEDYSPFAVGALDAFRRHGYVQAADAARFLAAKSGGAGIRDAARRCSEELEQRLLDRRQRHVLLRAAASDESPDSQLLRGAVCTDADECLLLRAQTADLSEQDEC
jgi:hypothetical protein